MGIVTYFRDAAPAHYKLKIGSFSSLKDTKIDVHESGVFEAGGYKWRLTLYPKGIHKKDHVSLYLTIADTKHLTRGWEIFVDAKMFVFSKKMDKYYTIQDGKDVWRFHDAKTQWGFEELISLKNLNDTSKEYIDDDGSCIFGVEIFVIKYTGKGESLSIIKPPISSKLTWKITNFPQLDEKLHTSEVFTVVGPYKWHISMYAKGGKQATGENLSLYVKLSDTSTIPPGQKLYAEYKLRVVNQFHKEDDVEKSVTSWFSSESRIWGLPNIMPLSNLKGISNGFLVNNLLIVEAQIMVMSHIEDFS